MELILASILAFTSTNIDDIFLLMLFFGNKRFKPREILFGQLLGITVLVAASLTISLIGLVVDKAYVGLLGFLPIYLGLRDTLKFFGKRDDSEVRIEPKNYKNHALAVSGVTIANGGDNIGIYVPLFGALTWLQKTIMISVFLMMTVLWCLLARYLIRHPLIAATIERYGHAFTPVLLILLGLYILYESNTISLIL